VSKIRKGKESKGKKRTGKRKGKRITAKRGFAPASEKGKKQKDKRHN